MRLFADRCFPITLYREALNFDYLPRPKDRKNRRVELDFSHHDDHDNFDHNTSDETWIRTVSRWKPKPIILTYDGRILRNPVSRRILKDSGLSYLYIKGLVSLPYNEQLRALSRDWIKIIKKLRYEKGRFALTYDIKNRKFFNRRL